MKVSLVKVIEYIAVEVPPNYSDEDFYFHVEENSCPGTGMVYAALSNHEELCKPYCGSCNRGGDNTVIGIVELDIKALTRETTIDLMKRLNVEDVG